MNKLTAKEILKILEGISYEEFGMEDYDPHELGLGDVDEVAQVGGGGEGSTWYSVKYFKDHDVYIRIDGWYESYSGTDFENAPYEVKPKPKTITVYESASDEVDIS